MVAVAQLVEHQIVALRVVGSSPISHPSDRKAKAVGSEQPTAFCFCACFVFAIAVCGLGANNEAAFPGRRVIRPLAARPQGQMIGSLENGSPLNEHRSNELTQEIGSRK